MCNFLSAIVLRNGHVLHHPMLDSHADLVRYFKLAAVDTAPYLDRFAKVELTPVDWMDVSTWTWCVDEETRPQWLDDVEGAAEKSLRAIAGRMIIREDRDLIVDGCWIVGGSAKVCDVRSGWIRRVQDSAQIIGVGDSAQIRDVGGSAQIRDVGGSAQIRDVGDSAQIIGVGDSAQIRDVGDSAQLDASAKAHVK